MSHGRAARALLAGGLLALGPSWGTAVHDDLGRPVQLEQVARRIVTLAPHATELVLAVGADSALVAVATGSEVPADPARLPRIGGPGALDRERLLALRPDLVIAWQSGNRAADLDWMDRVGITLYRSEPQSLQAISRALQAIGRLTGRTVAGDAAARHFERSLTTPCHTLPLLPVYVEVWDTPPMTVGGVHWINDALRRTGYRNLFEGVSRGVFAVSSEVLWQVRERPVISLLRQPGDELQNRLADRLSRPSPGLAEAIDMLCERRRGVGPRD